MGAGGAFGVRELLGAADVDKEGYSVDEFHREVPQVPLGREVVEGRQVRVAQAGQGAELLLEAIQCRRVEALHGLERDDLVAAAVAGAVDHPHAAATDLAQDPVVPQMRERRRGGRALGPTPLTRDVVRGFALFHQGQGGQHVADVVGVLGVAAGELLDGGALALPESVHELVSDLPQRVRAGRVVVAHPKFSRDSLIAGAMK